MLTIWGTPQWANGGKGQNYAPTKMSDMLNFAKALASRYSGRYNGYPFVRYYTVWNESNLGQFLSPQYDSKGKPVAPEIYAKIYRAAYAGIKAGNSARARRHRRDLGPRPRSCPRQEGTQETESPGKFAELLSKQKPTFKFDAWSHHPYPTSINGKPISNVRWPNVTLAQMPRFESSSQQLVQQKNVPFWITEYGHETSRRSRGRHLRTAGRLRTPGDPYAAGDPKVTIFIWFILRDDPTSAWQSGLVQRDGAKNRRSPRFSRSRSRWTDEARRSSSGRA